MRENCRSLPNHAFSLHCVLELECLQSGGVASDVKVEEGPDKMNMATPSNGEPISLTAEISLSKKLGDYGVTKAEINNDDLLSLDLEKSAEASISYDVVPSDGTSSITLDGNDILDSSNMKPSTIQSVIETA